MKHVMKHETTGIIGLFFSWYTAVAGFITLDKLPMYMSIAASAMTFIYYYRKNKRENKKP
jgi:hypothetical protein